MNKLFQMIGGRKFVLTVVSMLGAAAIDLYTNNGLSMPLATFLGAALAAFCASNYAVSKEYMRTEADKKTHGVDATLEKKLDQLLLAINSIDNSAAEEYYRSQLESINNALVEIAQASANTLVTAKATNNTLQAALNVAGKK